MKPFIIALAALVLGFGEFSRENRKVSISD